MTLVRLRRLALVALGAASLVALGALPAAAKTSSPTKWGNAFCGGLTEWSDTVTTGADEIETSLSGTTVTPEQGKATIVAFVGDIADATGDFYDRVKRAGNPDSTNGPKIQKEILKGIAGLQSEVEGMQTTASALPTTDVASFQTAVRALSAAFDTVSGPFDQAMNKVAQLDKSDNLSKQLQKLKSCKALFA